MTKPPFPLAIDSTVPCKLWTKALSTDGYGIGWFTDRLWKAHRKAFFDNHGYLTPGLDVCHICNNKTCWEPAHLYEGTRLENMKQATQDGLTSKKLTPEQVREIRKLLKEPCEWRNKSARDRQIGKLFGVSRTSISDIRLKRAWRNLDD